MSDVATDSTSTDSFEYPQGEGQPTAEETVDAEVVTDTNTESEASAEPETPAEKKERRSRGGLEAEVKRVCDEFVTGTLTLPEGELLTPHRIAKTIKEQSGLAEAPSTGAVAAVMGRWKEIGFADLNEKPLAFTDYTDEGRTEGLTALKAASADRKRSARAAAKAAEAAAKGSADGSSSDSAE